MKETLSQIPIAKALIMADQIAERLRPLSERLQITGSIRRLRPLVNDVDIVILAPDQRPVRERILEKCPRVLANGRTELQIQLANGLRVDFWFAQPAQKTFFQSTDTLTNFGSLVLYSTGSRVHNMKIAAEARRLNRRWNPFWGMFEDDACIACETEEDIYAAVKMKPIAPEDRE